MLDGGIQRVRENQFRGGLGEAFGLGAVTGGLLLLTAPSPSPRRHR